MLVFTSRLTVMNLKTVGQNSPSAAEIILQTMEHVRWNKGFQKMRDHRSKPKQQININKIVRLATQMSLMTPRNECDPTKLNSGKY